jgi:FkbM family methyltransferase
MRDPLKLGAAYRAAANGCAAVLSEARWAERLFVPVSRSCWNVPAAGRFIRSVAYRLADRLFANGTGVRDVVLAGVPLRLDVGHWTTREYYFADAMYEPMTVRHLASLLRTGDVFVDAGANSGYFTLLAAGIVGSAGRVVAFEPNPAVRERLAQNVHRNGFDDRVEIAACALSDRNAERVPLFVPLYDGLATLVPDRTHAASAVAGAPAIDVAIRTFDDWLAASSIKTVTLMKIDVEGAEMEVLAGMRSSLASRRVRHVILETAVDSPAHRLLVELGFQATHLETSGPVANIAYALVGTGLPSSGNQKLRQLQEIEA